MTRFAWNPLRSVCLRARAQYPFGVISAYSWVTLVFVLIDYFQAKFDFFGKWATAAASATFSGL